MRGIPMIQQGADRFISLFVRFCSILAIVVAPAASAASQEEAYASAWGPEVGSMLPLLSAPDQSGRLRALEDLAGEQGLLLFLNRSADW